MRRAVAPTQRLTRGECYTTRRERERERKRIVSTTWKCSAKTWEPKAELPHGADAYGLGTSKSETCGIPISNAESHNSPCTLSGSKYKHIEMQVPNLWNC